jgi:hypothetical protein
VSYQGDIVADDSQKDETILVGLKEVGVMIGLDLIIQEAGITTATLRPDIEAKLSKANFQIIPKAELLERNMVDPMLIINFDHTTKSAETFSYKMQLIFRRHRLILGNDRPKEDVKTWSFTEWAQYGQAKRLKSALLFPPLSMIFFGMSSCE